MASLENGWVHSTVEARAPVDVRSELVGVCQVFFFFIYLFFFRHGSLEKNTTKATTILLKNIKMHTHNPLENYGVLKCPPKNCVTK